MNETYTDGNQNVTVKILSRTISLRVLISAFVIIRTFSSRNPVTPPSYAGRFKFDIYSPFNTMTSSDSFVHVGFR